MMARLPRLALVVAGLAVLVLAARTAQGQPAPDCSVQPYAEAQVAGLPKLELELADDPSEQSRGLMFRESLPENAGMLFVFEPNHLGPFWNLNTLIPLSIAYMADDGTILQILDMQPQTPRRAPDLYPADQPYRYALEVNQGWFARNGVAVGNVLRLCLVSLDGEAPAAGASK